MRRGTTDERKLRARTQKDTQLFRLATQTERAILEQARADLLRGWMTKDDNLASGAYLNIHKTLNAMRLVKWANVRRSQPRGK